MYGFQAGGMHPTGMLSRFIFWFSYLNQQTGESRIEKYKGQEAAWVEQIKICGDDTGKQPLQKACIVLRIEVIHYDI